MKKIAFILMLLVCSIMTEAKTTYIPTYFTRIDMKGAKLQSDSTTIRELTMMAEDGRYAIIVMHDSVTKERVKAIKRMKAAAGWAAAAAVLNGVSATLQPIHSGADAIRYMNKIGNMGSSVALSTIASATATNLERVPVNIRIENYTQREMVVNDLNRGLTWFILPGSFINLSVGNPEENKFRIAYADPENQKKDYITVFSGNVLKKESIVYENDKYWYFRNTETIEVETENFGQTDYYDKTLNYEKVDKVTFEHTIISVEDYEKGIR